MGWIFEELDERLAHTHHTVFKTPESLVKAMAQALGYKFYNTETVYGHEFVLFKPDDGVSERPKNFKPALTYEEWVEEMPHRVSWPDEWECRLAIISWLKRMPRGK